MRIRRKDHADRPAEVSHVRRESETIELEFEFVVDSAYDCGCAVGLELVNGNSMGARADVCEKHQLAKSLLGDLRSSQ